MTVVEWIAVITAFISVVSLIGNVIQYAHKRESNKDLRRFTQAHYNNCYHIARALTRARNQAQNTATEERLRIYEFECNYIRGIADSSRLDLMAFAREELNFTLEFEHPAYPGKGDFSDQVKMGLPPEKEQLKVVEVVKEGT